MNGFGGFTRSAAVEDEDIDDVDEDEDSPASTIVPSSPIRSRQNSLTTTTARNEGDTLAKLVRARMGSAKENKDHSDINHHRHHHPRIDSTGATGAGESGTQEDTEQIDETSSSSNETTAARPSSKLHPRVAVILGVDRKWYLPLVICRAISVVPALWWGLRCGLTFLAELLRIRPGMWREGWVAIIISSAAADWDVERRFRVTEVALAIMWVC